MKAHSDGFFLTSLPLQRLFSQIKSLEQRPGFWTATYLLGDRIWSTMGAIPMMMGAARGLETTSLTPCSAPALQGTQIHLFGQLGSFLLTWCEEHLRTEKEHRPLRRPVRRQGIQGSSTHRAGPGLADAVPGALTLVSILQLSPPCGTAWPDTHCLCCLNKHLWHQHQRDIWRKTKKKPTHSLPN